MIGPNKKSPQRGLNERLASAASDVVDNKVDNGKGQYTDNKTNNAIKNSVFGFFNLAGVAGGGHVLDATNDDDDYGYDAEDANYSINDI